MTAPAKTSASRLRAPLALTRADADIDPPTGMPRKTPATMLPTPWPMKSREGSDARPSGLGMPAETAAPWTSPMNASDNAGMSREGMSAKEGSTGSGSELRHVGDVRHDLHVGVEGPAQPRGERRPDDDRDHQPHRPETGALEQHDADHRDEPDERVTRRR